MTVSAADERAHRPGPELRWSESWTFDFATPDAALGGWARITRLPNLGVGWYHAFLCGAGRDLVAVIDHEVPLPDRSLEIRAPGLWATHICETPLDHWTIGLEAFGIEVDDPTELYGRQLGNPMALGFDLEWEAEAPADDRTDPTVAYHQMSKVTGEVLVGDEAIELDAVGRRDHRWGPPADWDTRWFRAHGRLDDGSTFTLARTGDEAPTGSVDEEPAERVRLPRHAMTADVPEGAELELDALSLTLAAQGITTVELTDPEGRRTRAPRALCTVDAADGRRGVAWADWNEPC